MKRWCSRTLSARSALRRQNRKELKASWILALPLEEASVKSRTAPPTDDDSADAARDTWAGVLPISTFYVRLRCLSS
jgi:uncharacterized protein